VKYCTSGSIRRIKVVQSTIGEVVLLQPAPRDVEIHLEMCTTPGNPEYKTAGPEETWVRWNSDLLPRE
jgi:hypothetical protein